jgi:glycosyltransferase involved in cell wall biosynthesis
MPTPGPIRIAICVCTYARPDGLARLLDALREQVVSDPPIEFRVVIVDNDATGPVRAACEARAADFALGLRYEVEPTRGITYARNRGLASAGDDVDFIAMADDDEVPVPGWLATLVRVQMATRADVVTGPVVPHFPTPPPAWIRDGGFFDRPRYPTGRELPHAYTGNVLVRRAVIDAAGRFDDRFALTGGEDLEFFRRVRGLGYRIVWADDALIREWVPASRANMPWLLRRSYRAGNTLGQLDREQHGAAWTRVTRVVRGAGRFTQGLLLVPVAMLAPATRRVRVVRALALVWRGAGMITGVFGGRYEEYRISHPV